MIDQHKFEKLYDLCVIGGDLIEETRKQMMEFFNGGGDPKRLCFTYNASDSLNILIQGMARQGDHVITTMVEKTRMCGMKVLRSMIVAQTQCTEETTKKPITSRLVRSRKNISVTRGV